MRANNRQANQIRPVAIHRNYIHNSPGTVMIEMGNTKVICCASVTEGVPRFLRNSNQGWLTAEYGMLPAATNTRTSREASRGKQSGRTQEIQRLIGRSLRNAIDLTKIPEITINIDCDVIQADGGTRCAAITGSSIALFDLIQNLINKKTIKENPLLHKIAAVSVGIFNNEVILDLDYLEDSKADTDMNVIMTENNEFIEIQGTAEGQTFSSEELTTMLEYGRLGIKELIGLQ